MNRLAHLLLLDIRLLAKSKVFYLKLILLPLALILILGSVFNDSGNAAKLADMRPARTAATFDIPKVEIAVHTKPISIMEYESVAMMVMFSILTAFELAHGIVKDKLNHTLPRIRSTPVRPVQYALGKLLGITLAIAVQMAVVIAGSWAIFGVVWPNIPDVMLVTAAYGFAVGAIVLACGFAAGNQASISSFAAPILYGFSFLGGSLVDKYSFPRPLRIIQQAIPNGKAINCYLNLFQGNGLREIYPDVLKLAAIGAAFFGLSLFLLNGKRWIEHADIHHDHEAAPADA